MGTYAIDLYTWIALTLGIVGGFANVALRRRPAVAPIRT
jgi:hypothetical protein